MTDRRSDPDAVLDTRATEIARLDDALVLDVAGVAQAADEMRQALDALDQLLDARAFDRAAQLGYGDIASAFVFLQRTLGALQGSEHNRSALVSEVAVEMGCAWEEAEPHVTARMASLRPRGGGEADGIERVDRPAIVTPAGRVTVPRAVLEAISLGPAKGLRFVRGPDGRVEVRAENHADLRDLRERVRGMGDGSDVGGEGPAAAGSEGGDGASG